MRSTEGSPQETEKKQLDGGKPRQGCVVTQKPRRDISRWGGGHTRGQPKGILGVSTGSHFNFDQRNFWKQKLEARMNRVGERVGKVISGDDEK